MPRIQNINLVRSVLSSIAISILIIAISFYSNKKTVVAGEIRTDQATTTNKPQDKDVEPASSSQKAQNIDPRAKEILKNMSEYLKNTWGFSFKADISFDEVLPSGPKLQFSATDKVSVRRPDRIRAVYDGDLDKRKFWYDGKSVTLLDTEDNLYSTFAAPPEIDAAIDFAIEKYGLSVPLADLLYSDPYKILTENVVQGFYVGKSRVQGADCYHLLFIQNTIDWQAWIEIGNRPLPRKAVITYKNQPGAPQYTALLSDWDFSSPLPDSLFKFQPPEGAEQIDILKVDKKPE